MKIGKIVLAAVVFTIIAQIVHSIGAYMTMDYYLDPNYFAVWSNIMMPTAGPPPAEFYYYSIAFNFITGLIFAFIYTKVKDVIKSKKIWMVGKKYGIGVWLIASVPGALSMHLLINLPAMLIVTWSISSLIVYVLAGIATAKIMK